MERQDKLTSWIKDKHAGQIIKLTDEPYFNHLLYVAVMASPATEFGYEIGLCHDVLEKTDTSQNELSEALISFNYTPAEAFFIAYRVAELTDVFTPTAYPYLTKAARKEKEASRLLTISAEAQTVKYCDLVYNIEWVMRYNRNKAEKYLNKKKTLLSGLTKGDKSIYNRAAGMIDKNLEGFKNDGLK